MANRSVSASSKICLITFYLLLQFQFAYLLDFPITVSLLGLVFFISYFVRFVINYKIIISVSLCLCITILNQLTSNLVDNELQFFRTLLLILVSLVVLGNLLTAKIKPNVEQKLETMLFALLILAFMSILQTILGNRLGSFVTLPLGDFSYEYQYNADINSSITRASALYAEPSFNALICLSFLPLVLSIRDRKKRIVYSFITSAYMVSTFSLTGILSLGLILLVWSWEGRKIRIFPVLSLAGLFLITSNYVYDRWQSIGMIGSSANYRIIAPFKAIVEVIPENLFGIPLGSLEITMRKFEFLNGDRIGTSVDNGFLLIVLYFGLMGVMAVISIFAFTIRKAIAMQRKKMHGWPMVLVPCLTLNFNGGIFLPDFLCVLAFVIITIRSNIMRTIETEERL